LWKNVFAEKSMNQPSHKGGAVNNTPCAGDGRVFAMGPSGVLHGMDLATGKVLWERTGMSAEGVRPWTGARNMCTAPIYAGGTLIMPDHGSTLTGIDPVTGKDLWKLPGKGSDLQVPARWTHKGQDHVISLTAGGYNKQFNAWIDGLKIACIEAKTGRILWEMDVTTIPVVIGGVNARPKGLSVYGDVAYLTSWWIDRDNPANKERKGICTAYRLGLDKAERLWETPVPDAAGDPIPACNGSVVVVKGLTKESYLLDPTSGKVLATYAGDTGINECHAAIMEDKVIMSRDGSHGSSEMSILGATPETFSKLFCQWSQPHPQTTSYHNKYMTWPMVEGRIFMRGWDGVYCYDLRKK
jgi:outer membrane protein assembly factor BamB